MATADDCADTSHLTSGSDVVYDNICQPCKNEGNILEAEGRCEDCDEFLCKQCFQWHTLPSITRNHVMIGKEEAKKGVVPDKKDQCTQRCPQHSDEILKYYCLEHNFLGCSACMILDHKCTKTLYIPTVATDILNNEVCKKYKASKTAIETKANEITTHTKVRIDTANDYQAAALQTIRSFKKECVDMFDRAEKDVVEESENIKEEELRKQNTTQATSVAVQKDLNSIASKVETFESKKQYCNMFIAMIKAQDELKSCDDRLSEIDHRDEPPKKLFFLPNKSVTKGLTAGGIGKIGDEYQEIEQLKHARDIDVKTQSDKKVCWISSSVSLPQNKLIIVDFQNHKLKMVDFRENKVVEELQMPSEPWAVTATGPSEVAVTLPYVKKIAFVKTDGKLASHREIKVAGQCGGVACDDDKLVVSIKSPDEIQLMDFNGKVLKTVATNANENKPLGEPFYVSIHSCLKTVFVSNAKCSTVLCYNYDGRLLTTYTDKDLKMPLDMTFDDRGMLYVCDWNTHTVHQLTRDGKKARVILTHKDVTKPYTICYSHTENKFAIGMRGSDILKVFTIV